MTPATGRVEAWASVTPGGRAAMASVGTATSWAQAPAMRQPTTRAPAGGPEPSAAACSMAPAMSQPGRKPASAMVRARRTSPRLREMAETRMRASLGRGWGAGTVSILRRPSIVGSTTMAWMPGMAPPWRAGCAAAGGYRVPGLARSGGWRSVWRGVTGGQAGWTRRVAGPRAVRVSRQCGGSARRSPGQRRRTAAAAASCWATTAPRQTWGPGPRPRCRTTGRVDVERSGLSLRLSGSRQ